MCLQNSEPKEEPKKELYCHTCKKVVPEDEAAVNCWANFHDVETGEAA
jgi:hypothetical protein